MAALTHKKQQSNDGNDGIDTKSKNSIHNNTQDTHIHTHTHTNKQVDTQLSEAYNRITDFIIGLFTHTDFAIDPNNRIMNLRIIKWNSFILFFSKIFFEAGT